MFALNIFCLSWWQIIEILHEAYYGEMQENVYKEYPKWHGHVAVSRCSSCTCKLEELN